jgi:hypothetical protein
MMLNPEPNMNVAVAGRGSHVYVCMYVCMRSRIMAHLPNVIHDSHALGEPGSCGGQCQTVNGESCSNDGWCFCVLSMCAGRSSVGMKPPLGEDMDQMSGRRTGTGWGDTRRASVSVWDGIGRLILRCQTQILVYYYLFGFGYLVCVV